MQRRACDDGIGNGGGDGAFCARALSSFDKLCIWLFGSYALQVDTESERATDRPSEHNVEWRDIMQKLASVPMPFSNKYTNKYH